MHSAYPITKARADAPKNSKWLEQDWKEAHSLKLEHFFATDHDHKPETRIKLSYTQEYLRVLFHVVDNYVICKYNKYLDPVCRDSCVEFFVQPSETHGYFNFEINCGGTLLLYYIEDETRGTKQTFNKYEKVPWAIAKDIQIYSTMPPLTLEEITKPTTWTIELSIPLSVFQHYIPNLSYEEGSQFRANFYKCADESSHPHWASWAPLEQKNFHQPTSFRPILFT